MSDAATEKRNITLTITLDLDTMRHTISGSIPNPSWGVMLARILTVEIERHFAIALDREALAAVAMPRVPIVPKGRA